MVAILLISYPFCVEALSGRIFHFKEHLVLGGFCLAGGLCFFASALPAANDVANYSGREITVQGQVTDVARAEVASGSEERARFRLGELVLIYPEFIGKPLEGGLLLSLPAGRETAAVLPGNIIRATGVVKKNHPYQNPGRANTEASLRNRGINAYLSARAGGIRLIDSSTGSGWQAMIFKWRTAVDATMRKAMSPADAAVVNGSVFGGYAGIPREVAREFATTGIVHILSVSGSHIVLVAGVILWVGRRFRLSMRSSSLIATVGILLYASICGFSAPVVRSAVMGIAVLAAVGMNRMSDAPRSLALAILVMLAYEPFNLFDISFQLSVGCTVGLVFLSPRIMPYLKFSPEWAAEPLAVGLGAQAAVLPLISWYFNQFPLASFIANPIVVPVIEATIIVALAASLLVPWFPALAHLLFVGVGLMTGSAISINGILATLPFASVYIPSITVGVAVAYYLLLAWFFARPAWLPSSNNLIATQARMIGAILVILAVMVFWWMNRPLPVAVHFIDVGQGDAALIVTPSGRAVLVDSGGVTGSNSSADNFDVGEKVVVPYLKHYGVTKIDFLILTHGHEDHAGGGAAVASILEVKNVLFAGREFTAAERRLQRAMNNQGMVPVGAGIEFFIDGVSFHLLQLGDSQQSVRADSENAASGVVRITYGRHSFLLTGDLDTQGEKKLMETGLLSATVLKVGHHGSRTASSEEFLGRVNSSYNIISVGADNRFGHPHAETLKRLSARQARTFRTDRDGAIIFYSNGNELKVETFVQ